MTEIRKGLNGVVDYTAISKDVPDTNSLTYRAIPCKNWHVSARLKKSLTFCGTASFQALTSSVGSQFGKRHCVELIAV